VERSAVVQTCKPSLPVSFQQRIFPGNLSSPLSSREPVTFSIFSCLLHIQTLVFQPRDKTRHPERSASQIYPKQRTLARSRRTPAMLVGRCSREFSGRKLQRKIKSHKLRAKPKDLHFRGPFVEARSLRFTQNCHLDRSVPGFPATLHWKRPRVRLSVRKAA
jgi:hypothetical protein